MTLLIVPLATVGIMIQVSAGGGTDIASTTGFPIEETESFATIQSGFRPFVDCGADTGDIVAYDVSKGQDPSWFSTMLTDLEANGFVVREVDISTQGIPDCIVKLVVNAGLTGFSCIFTSYSNTEAALISNWVANGGALLLLSENRFCDNDKTIAVVSALGATFGGTTSFGEKVLTSGVNYDPNIPTTMWNGVNSWKIFSAREYLISNDGVVATFANGNAAKIAKEFGDGCVVMTGNIDHLRNTIGVNGISFLDHRQLALNNFLWLNECIEPEPADIHVLKFNDLNANGEQDPGEEGIEGWEILLECTDETSRDGTTDPKGMVWFEEIPAPNLCVVSEEQRLNWLATTPTSVTVELNPEDDKEVTFGNVRPLETEKFYTETEIDIEAGDFGVKLPFKEDGTQTVQAVIHPKKGTISSYNPGQYYAVTKVTALVNLDRVWIFEDDRDCTDGISKWNPAKVPGGAYVALMCDGVTVDLTSELANADPPQLFRNEATGLLEAHVEGVPAGCMVFLGVKYSPGLKGETFGDLGSQDLFCENREFVCLSQEGFPTTPNEDFPEACKSASSRDSAHRVLEVVECGENEVINPANGKCICPEGFVETPSGICVSAEF